jgi:hypothetical protein
MQVLGKMKNACNGKPLLKFAGLRSKMYSLLTYDENMAKGTAMGVKKRYATKHLRQEYICERCIAERSSTPN